MFRCIKYSRHHYMWMLLLLCATVAISGGVYSECSTLLSWFASAFYILSGICIVDGLVDVGLRRAFKVAFTFKLCGPANNGDVYCVNVRLALLAENIQRAIGVEHDLATCGNEYLHLIQLRDAKHNVRYAMRAFWHAHWLARIFGFELKKSWKEYLQPAQSA